MVYGFGSITNAYLNPQTRPPTKLGRNKQVSHLAPFLSQCWIAIAVIILLSSRPPSPPALPPGPPSLSILTKEKKREQISPIPSPTAGREYGWFPLQALGVDLPLSLEFFLLALFLFLLEDGVCKDDDVLTFLFIAEGELYQKDWESLGGGRELTEYRSMFRFCKVWRTSAVVIALRAPTSSTLISGPRSSEVRTSMTVSAQ